MLSRRPLALDGLTPLLLLLLRFHGGGGCSSLQDEYPLTVVDLDLLVVKRVRPAALAEEVVREGRA